MLKHAFENAIKFLLVIASVVFCASCNRSDDNGSNEITTEKIQNAPAVGFSHCVVSNSKFESKLLGIGAELDSDWRFANDEELATANGLDEISDKSLEEALETKTFICDMIAEKEFEGGANSITLTFPNMGSSGSADMSEREYAESTMIGINNATAVIETIRLGRDDHVSIRLVGKTSGTDYYQRMIFVKKNGYLGMITLTCISEDDIYDIISRFYAL